MATWIIVKKDDLSIQGHYQADEKDDTSANRSWLHAEPICMHLEMPAQLDPECVKCEDGQIVADQVKIDAKEARKWDMLRAQRDMKLAACDWTQMPDSPLTAQTKADYADYRQALRDLPANTVDPLNPSWPSEPA